MRGYDVAQSLSSLIRRVYITAGVLKALQKQLEVPDAHAAVGKQQLTEIGGFVTHGFFIQETVNVGVIPNLVNHLCLICTHYPVPIYDA